jgi:hypothetical protein
MSIPIIWPDDMEDKPTNTVKINNLSNSTESQEKPEPSISVEQKNLFDLPIEIDVEANESNNSKKKKKYCNRECVKDGEIKKCREDVKTCKFHICQDCKEKNLDTDDCLHKPSHNFDKKPPRLNKEIGAAHLYNLQFSCYLTMETLLARTDAKYRVDGLTEKLEEKRDAYKACLEEIYEEYGSEIDTVVSPIMTWAMLTSVDIGTSVYENAKKNTIEN